MFDNGDAANDFITNVDNWDNGLPTGQQGTIGINAGYDSNLTMTGYDIVHSAGTVNRSAGLAGLNVGSGSVWLANGTAAYSGFRGLSVSEGGSYTQQAGVTGDFTNNNRDSQTFGDGSAIVINGGTFSVGRDLIVRNGATFTVNGGIVTVADQLFTQSFASASNGWFFNGGSTTADNFQLDTAGTAFFGGSSAGSLELLSLGVGVTLDWSAGSQMELTVGGADQAFYEGLYTGGTLLFESSNSGAFGDNFQVDASTLSLIPEPSFFGLMASSLALWSFMHRRRD